MMASFFSAMTEHADQSGAVRAPVLRGFCVPVEKKEKQKKTQKKLRTVSFN